MGCQFSNNVHIPKNRHDFPIQLLLKDQVIMNNPQTNSNFREKDIQECLIDRSIRHYQEYIQKNPQINCDLDGLGNTEDQIGYIEGKVQKWYQDQRQQGLIFGNPYDSLSLCYSLKENVSEGIKWYNQMIGIYPNVYQLYFGLGNLYYKIDMYQQAQQKYRKCIELKPEFAKAYQTIANIYCYKKFNNELAKQWARFTLKLNPSNEYAALIYTLTEDNAEKRINLLMKLREACPNYARLCNAFGAAFFENNHIDKAIQWYLKGYSINPNYYALCCSLGLAYSQKMDLDSSHKMAEQLQSQKKLDNELSAKSKKTLIINSNIDEAQKWYSKCIQVNPNVFIAHYELAMIHLSRQQHEQTINQLQKCIQINPQNIQCYIWLAKIYIKKKQHTLAANYIKKALQIDQNNQECILIIDSANQQIKQLLQRQKTKDDEQVL